MDRILIAAAGPAEAEPAGKTTIVAGLAGMLAAAGRSVWACRLRASDEGGASADTLALSALPDVDSPGRALTVDEAESASRASASASPTAYLFEHDASLDLADTASRLDARIVLVVRNPLSDGLQLDVAALPAGRVAGVIANFVPESRIDSTARTLIDLGLPFLGAIPEDRTLAAPTIAQVREALQAEVLVSRTDENQLVEHPVIGPILSDTGRLHLGLEYPKGVVTRADRTDIHLAAFDTGTPCLIITGGAEPLEYLIDRAARHSTTVLSVTERTAVVMKRLDALYGRVPFAGERKRQRIVELMAQHIPQQGITRILA